MYTTIDDFNLGMVLLSYVIATFGALTGLLTSRNIPLGGRGIHYGWLMLSAFMLGTYAIWSMHFVGMLAYEPGMPITYDLNLTLLSLVFPIAMMAGGLWAAYRWRRSLIALAVAGVIMGFGIAAMHYTGMMAMRVQADMTHATGPVVASVVIGVVASFAALYIVRETRGALRYAGAPVMGVAVCALHYTGMAGMALEPNNAQVNYFDSAVTSPQMLFLIAVSMTTAIMLSVYLFWWQEERWEKQAAAQRR